MSRPVRLSCLTWDHPRAVDGLFAMTERYHRMQDEVRLTWHRQSLRGFESTPVAANAERFDIIILDHPFMGDAAASGCLVDLNSLPALSRIAGNGRFVGMSLQSYNYAGGQWALPLDAACQTAVYRPDQIAADELPRTMRQVLDLDPQIGIGLSMACPHSLMHVLTLCGLMGDDVGGSGDRLLDPCNAEEAIELLRQLIERAPAEASSWSSIGLLEVMATSDRVAYCPMVYCFNSYSRPQTGNRRLLKFADLPIMRPDVGCAGSVIGGAGLAISADSRSIGEAADFLRFLVEDEAQTDMAVMGGQPAADAAWTSRRANAANNNFMLDCLATMRSAVIRPRHATYMTMQNEAGDMLQEQLYDRSIPARRLIDRIERLFEETRLSEARK